MLLFPFVLLEWALLVALLPFAVVARLLGWPWTVVAEGRRPDGTRVRYEAAGSSPRAAAAEIRTVGAPTSLGVPTPLLDDTTARLRDQLRDGREVSVSCLVQGYGTAKSRDGWIEGRLTAVPGLLTFVTGGGLATWPLLGSDDPVVGLAGPADRAAVGVRVIASYGTPIGQFRVAVAPDVGPLLGDLLGAGARCLGPTDQAWAMWRQDDAGAVREIARFGSRADAELLAENLAARGSRQRFWLAAARR